jgi:hypothetical protein
MIETISASVGSMGGRNRPPDVITVQQLLNRVPLGQGCPFPELQVDGLCGFKTISAILRFQLQHFGWQGRDGRVDPDGRTLEKLNELTQFAQPALRPLTKSSQMSCPHGGSVSVMQVQNGNPVLSANDQFFVAGCALQPVPCAEVKWLVPFGTALNELSQGWCITAAKVPQGPVIVLAP